MNFLPPPPNPHRQLLRTVNRAFSLIEVTLALGIISFVGITILGLLPIAMNSLRTANYDTVSTRIASLTRADLQQVDMVSGGASVSFFGVDGEELDAGDPDVVYQAYRAEVPHPLPGAGNGRLNRISVQIVHYPSGIPLPTDENGIPTVPPSLSSHTLLFYVLR